MIPLNRFLFDILILTPNPLTCVLSRRGILTVVTLRNYRLRTFPSRFFETSPVSLLETRLPETTLDSGDYPRLPPGSSPCGTRVSRGGRRVTCLGWWTRTHISRLLRQRSWLSQFPLPPRRPTYLQWTRITGLDHESLPSIERIHRVHRISMDSWSSFLKYTVTFGCLFVQLNKYRHQVSVLHERIPDVCDHSGEVVP